MGNKDLKAQLRQANSLGVSHTVIICEQELATASVILRDMTNAQQKTVPLDELVALLRHQA
jgi:histidyl-tRNA synthetase